MHIALVYNKKKENTERQAEWLTKEDVANFKNGLQKLGHRVTPIAVGDISSLIDKLLSVRPDLIFNVAMGSRSTDREGIFPAVYTFLNMPFTGGNARVLLSSLNKRLVEKLLGVHNICVPKGLVVDDPSQTLPEDLQYPLMIKPNYEGSGMGIHASSIAETAEDAGRIIAKMLKDYPHGINVEEYIKGREITVPMLSAWPERILEIVEYKFTEKYKYNIYDYEHKQHGLKTGSVEAVCPAELTDQQRDKVLKAARRIFSVIPCSDMGRIDFRLSEKGEPYFIEINPIPRIQPDASLVIAAKSCGLSYEDVLKLIIQSASGRHQLYMSSDVYAEQDKKQRLSCREHGICIGRFNTGKYNAITDVKGVHVGHVTHIEDNVQVPGEKGTGTVRTGITAVVPYPGQLFNEHLAAGGFVLNGIGEMSGLTQAIEWGWMETPLLLTNTMSVGRVHTGIVDHMLSENPDLGTKVDVTIPLVGETNDAFLNDVRIFANTPDQAMQAIRNAKSGKVEQGSVGAGTGMISFDFAGGIGTSSRVIQKGKSFYTIGVLVESNFGKMHNLTIDGSVIGRHLDPLYPYKKRRRTNYGSVIVVVATDAPLLSSQLNRLSKRAALGLGRAGSYSATTSGEIVFSFSTANPVSRKRKQKAKEISLSAVNDQVLNLLYEAVIETTEEAVINALFSSPGMKGRDEHYAPPLPVEVVKRHLRTS